MLNFVDKLCCELSELLILALLHKLTPTDNGDISGMLSYLGYREVGFHSPQLLRNAEQLRRTYTLQLSRKAEVVSAHKGAIHSLDIDSSEGRYLLSGGADGVVCIFDIEEPIRSKQNKAKIHQVVPLAKISK